MIAADQPTIFDRAKVVAAVSSREDGNMSFVRGPQREVVVAARQQWLGAIGHDLNQTVVMMVTDPTAWDVIADVDETNAGHGAFEQNNALDADALVTTTPGITLCLLTADCIPIIMHDPEHGVLALAHMGWQSTNVELAPKVIRHLQQKYGSEAAMLKVYFGPAIKAASYIFETPVQADDPRWQPFLYQGGEGVRVDNVEFNRQQLIAAGVAAKNIEVCATDTAASPHYFSHYRAVRQGSAETEGRFATIAMLV